MAEVHSKSHSRIYWVDSLKGLCILVVVFIHCSIALRGNVGHLNSIVAYVNNILIYQCLGLFFFMSGIFIQAGLKRGIQMFLVSKLTSVLYPFVVWSVIYGGLKFVFSSFANNPQSPENILLSYLTGGGDITWFLHSLFLSFFLVLATRKCPEWVVFVLSGLLVLFLPPIPSDSVYSSFDNNHFNKSIYLFMFMFMGDVVSRRKVDLTLMSKRVRVILISAACFLFLSVVMVVLKNKISMVFLSPFAMMAIPFFIWIAMRVQIYALVFIGANSIVFYLFHYLIIQLFSKLFRINHQSS